MSLPIEVQFIIAEQLSERRDIHAMTLVNTHFANMFQPLLYKEVDVGWSPEEPSPLTLATRTLLDRPDLAACVESLRLDGYEFPERAPDAISTICVTGLNMIKAAGIINHTGAYFADLWTQGVLDGEVDALVALLIAIVPNVKDIYLGIDFCIEVLFLTLMLDRREQSKPNVNLPTLEHLTNVTMENHYADLFNKVINFNDGVLNFFNLPQLESLSVAVSPISAQPWRPDERFQLMTNLTFLHLSRASEEQLGAILSLTPKIVHLKLSCYWCPREEYIERSQTVIDLDKLRTALKKRRNSLQYLTLEVIDNAGEIPEFIWPMELTGTSFKLTDFTKLVKLVIPWVLLTGWCRQDSLPLIEKLPMNLVSLTLTDDLCYQDNWRWTYEAIRGLLWEFVAQHLNAPTSCLQELSLAGAVFGNHQGWGSVRGVCSKAGIRFIVHPTTPWEDEVTETIEERKRRYG
jgi:hypothetical protein